MQSVKVFLFILFVNIVMLVLFQLGKNYSLHNMSNSLLFISIIYIPIGFFGTISRFGIFDGAIYSVKKLFTSVFGSKNTNYKSFYDYKSLKHESKDDNFIFKYIMFYGLFNLLLSIFFVFLV